MLIYESLTFFYLFYELLIQLRHIKYNDRAKKYNELIFKNITFFMFYKLSIFEQLVSGFET